MSSRLNVSIIVGLVDRVSEPLRGLQNRMRAATDQLDKSLARHANLTFIGSALDEAGARLVAPLQAAVDAALELRTALTEVGIVAGKTAAEVGTIRPELRALSAQFGQSQLALVETLGSMTAKGLSFDQSAAALSETARAAAGLAADLADMEGTASSIIQSLRIDPGQLADPFNRMAAAANAGGFEVRDMAAFFPELTASMAKVDTGTRAVGTLSAALQIVRSGAGSAGQAATQMGDLLEKMFAPATVTALEKKFDTDLPAAMQQWRAEGKNVFDEFIALIRRVTGGDEFKIAEIYGDKEGRAALMSLMRNWEQFERIRATAAAAPAQDLIGKLFDQRLADDPALRMRRVGEQVANLKTQIGDALLPVVERLIPRVEALVASFTGWVDRNPALVAQLAAVVGGLGALMVVGGGAFTFLAGLLGSIAVLAWSLNLLLAPLRLIAAPLRAIGPLAARIGPAIRGMAMALMLVQGGPLAKVLFIIRAIGAALLANPVGLVVAAFIGAALVIRKYWEPISGFFSGLWSGITEGLAPLAPAFESTWGAVGPVITPIVDALGAVWDWLTRLLEPVTGTGAAAEAMGRRWGQAIAGMILKIGELLSSLLALPGKMFQIGSDIVQGLWNGWLSKWAGFKAWVSGLGDVIPSWLRSPLKVHSPSRVFADIGANLVAGLRVGMTQTIPGLMKDMGALAGKLAAVPLVAAPLVMAPAHAVIERSAPPPAIAPAQAIVERVPPPPVIAPAQAVIERSVPPPAIAPAQAIVERAPPSDRLRDLMTDDPESKARDARRLGWLREALARMAESAPQRIAAAQAPPVRRGAARGDVTLPITINVTAAPGMDARHMAALVRAQVEKATRAAGQRLSSALYDQTDDM